ncbi:zinc ABC transporter substrate-binding protein [Shouchella sp. 1P09AA]|uniref:metal ABC transporter solute-binding protein, Zn/Mn family n=1 Tax=unclassified Shouchella TaxID=2893065 RepID=UPI00399F9631
MRKITFLIGSPIIAFTLVACGDSGQTNELDLGDGLEIITTYSIIYDITRNIATDDANIYNLAPIGSDPHEYDPLPEDVKKMTDADVVFYNGLNLEEGNSWFAKLIEVAGKEGDNQPVFRVSERVEPIYLETQGLEQEEDPHAWLDLQNGVIYAENIRDALINIDPQNEGIYIENAENYITDLENLHQRTLEEFAALDEESRHLVTSEGAFKYFAKAYDIQEGYIWEINSENQGSPQQMKNAINYIQDNNVPVLFVETSIDTRSMETLSNETGVPIFDTIYTDSLGKEGTDGDTYLKMMEFNTKKIIEGLGN